MNTTTATDQKYHTVAANAGGDFVVTWSGMFDCIFFQRYDVTGTALGTETVVTAHCGAPDLSAPGIAMSDSGWFEIFCIVGYPYTPGLDDCVVGQCFDDGGNPIGSDWSLFCDTLLAFPIVTGKGDGDYAVLWWYGGSGDLLQMLTGSVGGSKNPVVPIDTIGLGYFDAAIDSSGNVVVVWREGYEDGYALKAQRYDFEGNRIGPKLIIKEETVWELEHPAVAMLDNGDFLVVWDEEHPSTYSYIYARRYYHKYGVLFPEVQINEPNTYKQNYPDVASAPDGRFIITWASDLNDGGDYNVCAREMYPLAVTDAPDMPIPELLLFQNYPNPFNPITMIEYSLPEPAVVSISIYNIQGQLVARLEKGTRPKGKHKATWDGCDKNGNPVSSGVYFYSLRAGTKSLTKKMLLLK